MKHTLILFLSVLGIDAIAQDEAAKLLKDSRTGCGVWYKHMFSEDSVSWSGGCKEGLADGQGTMIGYTDGKQTSQYIGAMESGWPHGEGVFTFWGDRRLEGNFVHGEPLFLSDALMARLEKNIVSETDSTELYDGDNNAKQLYYHAIVPKGEIVGTVVLMPGTWETTEHLLSSMRAFCEIAHQHHLAVLALSINQRLTLNEHTLGLMNTMLSHAIEKYNLPKDKFVMGGWSMGGLFSLRYTEFAKQDARQTAVNPVAVFSCDGPCDLEHIYALFKRKAERHPGHNEATYGMRELETHCGGTPEAAREKYVYYSAYAHDAPSGGMAHHLIHTPVRIYGDVDPKWWMENRGENMYGLNALDQTAMIQMLNDMGNSEAEFINAYQKGVRLEGNRHPHSWSIVEPKECVEWILKCLDARDD